MKVLGCDVFGSRLDHVRVYRYIGYCYRQQAGALVLQLARLIVSSHGMCYNGVHG